ncbi:ABC transporter permease [Eubacteriaceae bacterium ES2]|nr:ABC transporter permease [Eubacteriaceae bacterium ES2]
MNNNFYLKLAVNNIRKNVDTYIPYILAAMGSMVAFYMMIAFNGNKGLDQMPGSDSLKSIFFLGTIIIGIFSVIFLFYTNSFLIKRRKKELGLYSVLGLGKKHVAFVLMTETIIVALISIVAGLLTGLLLGKVLFLILLKLLNFTTPLAFYISKEGVILTAAFFSLIFLLTLLYNLFQVRLANPIELLQGSNVGEKEPKASWLLTLIGLLSLAGGYILALTVESPIEAIGTFFVAVVLVIIGTYCLFTSGSIVFLKKLKKNKKYYYQPRNFISVSGMIYRMKQNAVGLASICILSTMVLVTISTTVALYSGQESIMKNMFPFDVMIASDANQEDRDIINEAIDEQLGQNNVVIDSEKSFDYAELTAFRDGENYSPDEIRQQVNSTDYYKSVTDLVILSVADYNRINNSNYQLDNNQVLVFSQKDDYPEQRMVFGDTVLQVKENLTSFPIAEKQASSPGDSYFLIVGDEMVMTQIFYQMTGQEMLSYGVFFNITGSEESRLVFANGLYATLEQSTSLFSVNSADRYREEWYSIFGGFLFLGIFMGSLFLMATVLIIYFKQLSEGYEDRNRFEIMQNVGLDQYEVKKTINKQILIVFFLPLLTAVVHTLFAFPVLVKMLQAFRLDDWQLFLACMAVTMIAFAIIYAFVYKMTAKVYYRLVKNEARS